MLPFQLYKKLRESFEDNLPNSKTELILMSELDINEQNKFGNSLLHCTSQNNDIVLLKFIIETRKDVNLDIINSAKQTPLQITLRYRHDEAATILICSGADVNLGDHQGFSPLHFAVGFDGFDIARTLLKYNANINARDLNGETPLMLVCTNSDYSECATDMLKLLLSYGADVNIRNHWNSTVLMESLKKFRQIGEDVVSQIINNGCNLDCRDLQGNTALHLAVEMNSKPVAYSLLNKGIGVDICNSLGTTALHIAANRNLEICCMLLYYGAQPDLIDGNNNSPLLNAVYIANYELIKLLFLSYDGLNGDDCYKLLYVILRDPFRYRLNTPAISAMMIKFQERVINNEGRFESYKFKHLLEWWSDIHDTPFACFLAAFEFIQDLNFKIGKFNATEYFQFDSNYKYTFAYYYQPKSVCQLNNLRFIWASLSLGLRFSLNNLLDLLNKSGFGKELLALIWGGSQEKLINVIPPYPPLRERIYLWQYYLEFLHSDGKSIESKSMRYYLKRLFPHYKNNSRNMFVKPDKKKVKTLFEISLNQTKTFIRQRFNTENFYQCHEVVNNLDLPKELKMVLQLRTPVECQKCKVICVKY